MKKVVVVDYGMGNIDSVVRAAKECDVNVIVTDNPFDFEGAGNIILPGVGAFGEGMRNIRKRGIDNTLKEYVLERRIPFLGICLGMQLLAETSFEEGEHEGLGWIKGEVRRLIPDNPHTRIPHMGWNEVNIIRKSRLFEGIPSGEDFYFVHGYHLVCADKDAALATTPYCGGFVSAVSLDNIFGVQFHPEKSQYFGIQLLNNFLAL